MSSSSSRSSVFLLECTLVVLVVLVGFSAVRGINTVFLLFGVFVMSFSTFFFDSELGLSFNSRFVLEVDQLLLTNINQNHMIEHTDCHFVICFRKRAPNGGVRISVALYLNCVLHLSDKLEFFCFFFASVLHLSDKLEVFFFLPNKLMTTFSCFIFLFFLSGL